MDTFNQLFAPDAVPLILAITGIFMLAGLVKGVVGLGLPTVAVGLLALVMTPAEAASLLIVPSAVTNIWQLAAGPNFRLLLRRLLPMLLGICVGTLAGGLLLPNGLTAYAGAALGIALMLYAVIGLAAVRLAVPAHMERWLAPLVGITTGVVTSATGVFVIPAVPYLQGLRLEKDDLVQALGLAFSVSTFALAGSLALDGSFKARAAATSFYALVPALGGMCMGQWIRLRMRPELFRKIFFIGLLALGAHLSLRLLAS